MNARMCRVWGGIGTVFAFLLLIFNFSHHTSPLQFSKSSGHDGRLDNIYNATLGFERIFIINLPTRSDTRDLWTLAGHLTNVSVEFRDGVTDVHAKARPPGAEKFTNMPALGAWRANMDILQEMVAKGISSALIMEDDTDWDIRIKSQLETFARASRLLLQPGGDPLQSFEEDISKLKRLDGLRKEPTSSPYGDLDQWDVLWLGHLGTHTPDPGKGGNVAILNDHTVPEKQHIGDDWDDDQLSRYPDHTRIVERSIYTMGSQAYAISLPGARKMLYECGTKRIERAYDMTLAEMCSGLDGRPQLSCLIVRPQLISTFRPIARKSTFSNIIDGGADGEEYSKVAYSRNIRWSTKGNLQQLIYGYDNYTDLFMDGEPKPELG